MISLKTFGIAMIVVTFAVKAACAADLPSADPMSTRQHADVADDPAQAGEPLAEEDLAERGAWLQIVVVVVRQTTKVVITNCSRSADCRSNAAKIAAKLGGALAASFAGNTAYKTFCSSSFGRRYGNVGSVKICG